MKTYLNNIKKGNLVALMLSLSLMAGVFPVLKNKLQDVFAESDVPVLDTRSLALLQDNSLAQVANPQNPKNIMKVIITAYSSTPEETDDTPFITAAGTPVRDGIVANNLLPFGTKIKIPDLYGNKVFVVEDRMNRRKGNNQFDIWFPSHPQAENFGVKITYIEILED
jgi:3D (Asp-Asp-Asp) domain-containing protein